MDDSTPTKAARVLVCGYYGFDNTGDEAILDVLLADLRLAFPDPEITVLSGRPASIQQDHEVAALDMFDLNRTIEAAAAADLMVLGGGGLFQDYSGVDAATLLLPSQWGLTYYAGFVLLGALVGTPVAIYGAGVGPLNTPGGRELTARAFDLASRATVRDAASRTLLAELGVNTARVAVSADPAFLLEPNLARSSDSPSPHILVAPRPWADGSWMVPLAHALDEIATTHDATITLVPFQRSERPHEDDVATSRAIADLMTRPATVLDTAETPQQVLDRFGTADLAIGMRLHAVIFAALAGVPPVGIAYDPKVASAMAELDVGEYALDLSSIDDLPALANRALAERDDIRNRLSRTVPASRDRARRNADALHTHAASPRGDVGPVTAQLLEHRLSQWQRIENLTETLQQTTIELETLRNAHESMLASRAMIPARFYWSLKRALLGKEDPRP